MQLGRNPRTHVVEVVHHGSGCVHEWCVRSDAGYARRCVWERDRGRCAVCRRYDAEWQADHVVPVCEGGGECGLDGLRTLCRGCHKVVTAALAKRRAKRRRDAAVWEQLLRRD